VLDALKASAVALRHPAVVLRIFVNDWRSIRASYPAVQVGGKSKRVLVLGRLVRDEGLTLRGLK
jgi:hypothetical protein